MGKWYSDAEKTDIIELFKKGKGWKEIQQHVKASYGTDRKYGALQGVVKAAKLPPIKEFVKENAHIITDEMPELKTAHVTTKKHHHNLPEIELNKELEGFVPNIEGFADYLERKTLIDPSLSIMNLPLKDRKPIFFLGDTATGKTSLPEYLAAKYKYPFLLISADSSLNFNDLLFKVRFENATATYEPGLFLKFFENQSIIVIDELPSSTPDIFFKFHELLQQKRVFVKEIGKVYKQHAKCFIFASGNFKNSLYIGNNKLNEALVSRFNVKVVEDFTEAELNKILKTDDKMKQRLIQFYQDIKDLIKKQNKKFVISLRNLQSFIHLYNQGMDINEAFEWSVLDSIMVNNTIEDRKTVFNLAVTVIPGLGVKK
jgi:hypothetical protein